HDHVVGGHRPLRLHGGLAGLQALDGRPHEGRGLVECASVAFAGAAVDPFEGGSELSLPGEPGAPAEGVDGSLRTRGVAGLDLERHHVALELLDEQSRELRIRGGHSSLGSASRSSSARILASGSMAGRSALMSIVRGTLPLSAASDATRARALSLASAIARTASGSLPVAFLTRSPMSRGAASASLAAPAAAGARGRALRPPGHDALRVFHFRLERRELARELTDSDAELASRVGAARRL